MKFLEDDFTKCSNKVLALMWGLKFKPSVLAVYQYLDWCENRFTGKADKRTFTRSYAQITADTGISKYYISQAVKLLKYEGFIKADKTHYLKPNGKQSRQCVSKFEILNPFEKALNIKVKSFNLDTIKYQSQKF